MKDGPTLLVDVPHGAPVLTEEVFGPAAPLVIVRDATEAIARANDTRFGLSNNLWAPSRASSPRAACSSTG